MASDIPLVLHTAYAELLDRTASAAFEDAFAEEGVFTAKRVGGRTYWYFQVSTEAGRKQRYVGVETPDLLVRITRHKQVKAHERDRRALVSALVRSANLPRPEPQIGAIVAALADAGVFRLGGVLVGTVAYQTYSALLGRRLPSATAQTGDVDIAQFAYLSTAIGDKTPAILDVLRGVDPSFRPVPSQRDPAKVANYQAATDVRVEFLTPNQGANTDELDTLPASGTDAARLRYLDFLIRDPEPAVLLHGAGIHVSVPAPERFAVHKLIVSRLRRENPAKRDKDLRQAEALFDSLNRKRPHELREAWGEAWGRGKKWRALLSEGLGLIDIAIRDRTLKTIGHTRSIVTPRPELRFSDASPARYDFDRDVVTFQGKTGDATIRCAISGAALDEHFDLVKPDKEHLLKAFRAHRSMVEDCARAKYLSGPIDDPSAVLIMSEDLDHQAQDRKVSG